MRGPLHAAVWIRFTTTASASSTLQYSVLRSVLTVLKTSAPENTRTRFIALNVFFDPMDRISSLRHPLFGGWRLVAPW